MGGKGRRSMRYFDAAHDRAKYARGRSYFAGGLMLTSLVIRERESGAEENGPGGERVGLAANVAPRGEVTFVPEAHCAPVFWQRRLLPGLDRWHLNGGRTTVTLRLKLCWFARQRFERLWELA